MGQFQDVIALINSATAATDAAIAAARPQDPAAPPSNAVKELLIAHQHLVLAAQIYLKAPKG